MKKKIVCSLVLFALPLLLAAQNIYAPVKLTINSQDGVFAQGDSVKIYAEVSADVEPLCYMTVVSCGKTLKKETVALSAGKSLIYSGVFNKKASVMVNVGPDSDHKTATSIGFLVSPEEFRPGFDNPSDLQDFWKQQVAKMRKGKMKVKITDPVGMKKADVDACVCYHIEISMPEGNPARGYVAIPADAAKKSLPIFMYVHSAGVNKPQNKAKAEIACKYAKMGAIAIDLNAHGMLDDQPQSYYDDLLNGELKDCTSPKLVDSHENFYFRLMYLRMVRALDYLTKLPEWDGERIMVYGESQGGGQTLAISGIDPRVTHACAIVPAMTDTGGVLDKRKSGWPGSANARNAKTKSGKAIMPYYDGAVLVSNFKGKLYMEAGNVDLTCDPACVSAAYNNATTSTKEIYYFPYRPHSKMDKSYNKDWNKQVKVHRDEFWNNFFEGKR